MVRGRSKRFLHKAVLLAALLFAQVVCSGHFYFDHFDPDDGHPAGEICAICVVHGQMGTAGIAAAPTFAVVAQRAEAVEFTFVVPTQRRIESRLARGPPPHSWIL